MSNQSAIVIGAGIVGLATARALAMKGMRVTVIERSGFAMGASVRNFGMIWPIGQPDGDLYECAIRSRDTWKQICSETNTWYSQSGSIHVAHHESEWQVLQELYEIYHPARPWKLLNASSVSTYSPLVNTQGLAGALLSQDEIIVDPRKMISLLPAYLAEKYGVQFLWNKCVSYISDQTAYIGFSEQYEADMIFICSGADFETLYPEAFAGKAITKCKLQMMRFLPPPALANIGPAICGGLSLVHYNSFKAATSLQHLKARYEQEMPSYLQWGIHVMVSQHESGELTVGDSHEYGLTHQPFDKQFINQMIMDYLQTFVHCREWQLHETWNGIYSKNTNGDAYLYFSPEPGVQVLNGLGGAGMTLSFAIAENVVNQL